jgi:quaternary ammonium compound-resistance protein SugE
VAGAVANLAVTPRFAAIPDEDVSYPASQDDRAKVASVMSWLVLVVSGMLESVWAVALSRAGGFTRPLPTAVFAVSLLLSMGGLGYALRTIPVGTGYAVWVGIGIAGTAVAGMVLLGESASLWRVLSLVLVLAGVIGLKVFH